MFLLTAREDDPDGLIEEAGKNLDPTAATLICSSCPGVAGSPNRRQVGPFKPAKLAPF